MLNGKVCLRYAPDVIKFLGIFMAYVRSSTRADIYVLSPLIKQSDINEVLAATGKDMFSSLYEGFLISTYCRTIVSDCHDPIGMFGVAPSYLNPQTGMVWLLSSDQLFSIRKSFLKQCRLYIDQMLKIYPCLINYVDCRNTQTLRWLRWCGFKINRYYQNFGLKGEDFVEIIKQNKG